MPSPAAESRLAQIFGSAPNGAPSARDLMNGNRALPPNLKQSIVLLNFAEPIPRAAAAEFLRVHLTLPMTEKGESKPFMAEVFQPDRVGPQLCPRCGVAMKRLSLQYTRCENRVCESYGRRNVNGPMRGVVEVTITPEQILETDAAGVQWISGCLLILDRRYDETVLASVYRTAGALAEHFGWRLA